MLGWAFGNSRNGKLKRRTEMVKMKIVYFLIHTSPRPLELQYTVLVKFTP